MPYDAYEITSQEIIARHRDALELAEKTYEALGDIDCSVRTYTTMQRIVQELRVELSAAMAALGDPE